MEKKKILIVDDDEELVKILSFNLGIEGYETIAAYDGMSAVMRSHKDKPDLILLDIMMPGGNGFSVVEKLNISTKTCTIPVIVLSALPKDELKERALEAGIQHYYTKPFNMETLLNHIEGLLVGRKERLAASI